MHVEVKREEIGANVAKRKKKGPSQWNYADQYNHAPFQVPLNISGTAGRSTMKTEKQIIMSDYIWITFSYFLSGGVSDQNFVSFVAEKI